MTVPIDQIVEIKTEAKNQRDRGLKGYPRALAKLKSAIALATEGLAQTTVPDLQRQYAKELADCHGMIGGVERRWAHDGEGSDRESHLIASCLAYDAGYSFEWNPQYDIRASYNLVNRLTGRLMLRPELLVTNAEVDLGQGLTAINLPQALAESVTKIVQFLAKRGSFWAEADLSLLRVLLGSNDVKSAYAPFFALSPPDYAYASALDGLRPLAKLDIANATSLIAALDILEAHRSSGK